MADVAKAPAPQVPGGVPIPYPNVSSFAGGPERRYSVRFLQGIENRLAMAGLSPQAAKEHMAALSKLGRSEVEREGRIVDGILDSAHPKEGMALFGLVSQDKAMMARIGTGTATTSFAVAASIFGQVAKQTVQPGLQAAGLAVAVPAAVALAAVTVVRSMPQLMGSVALLLDQAGMREAAQTLREAGGEYAKFQQSVDPALAALTLVAAGAMTVATAPEEAARQFKVALDAAGQAVSASPRADANVERALLLLAAGTDSALAKPLALANELRGEARELLVKRFASLPL